MIKSRVEITSFVVDHMRRVYIERLSIHTNIETMFTYPPLVDSKWALQRTNDRIELACGPGRLQELIGAKGHSRVKAKAWRMSKFQIGMVQ